MKSATICLKPINDLLKENFYVASYQRGYRWVERQVVDLLKDIWEFQSKSDGQDKSAFYCLQPIVVKKRDDNAWELVDGQQRLTTILLLLGYLKPQLEALEKSRFTLIFETKDETSGAFLQNLDLTRRHDNIDYYHICNAHIAIAKWFSARDGSHKLRFLQCLLNDDEVGRNVKVIWYELAEKDSSVEAFTRLNIGKIPLTNSELVRALFLRSGNFEKGTMTLRQLRIAQEWDDIEKTLQSDEVWYFLHSGLDSPPNRIEYIFQLMVREDAWHGSSDSDPYHTFHYFNEKLPASSARPEEEWLRVKQYFMTLEEWFNDTILYNLIGFLIHNGDDLLAIRKAGSSVAKHQFHKILKGRIFRRLISSELPSGENHDELKEIIETVVDDLEYGLNDKKIRAFLLLFNIATLLENPKSNLRFPFDRFKMETWDIEHVRSVESGKPARPEAQRQWLGNASDYLCQSGESEVLLGRIQSLLNDEKIDGEQFDNLYRDLLEHFGEAESRETDNGIGNLALLDEITNRSYKNAVFPVKRRRVLGLDRNGTFVPLCTRNVFLKCYTHKISNMMFWSEEDRKDYCDAIVETFVKFFQGQMGDAL